MNAATKVIRRVSCFTNSVVLVVPSNLQLPEMLMESIKHHFSPKLHKKRVLSHADYTVSSVNGLAVRNFAQLDARRKVGLRQGP
jgi:hypothetical protein